MSWVAQPDQSFGVQLPCSLAGETRIGADQTIDGRRITAQTVAGHDDALQTLGQASYRIVQCLLHCLCFPHRRRFWLIKGMMLIVNCRRKTELLVGLPATPDA
jgi:hypothetical protein